MPENDRDLRKTFASNLNGYIYASGKSQKEVTKDLGYEQTTFNTWCKGKILPSLPKIISIAKYFGIPLDSLISNEDEKTREDMYLGMLTLSEKVFIEQYRSCGEIVSIVLCKLRNRFLVQCIPSTSGCCVSQPGLTVKGAEHRFAA